jgi:hypothetical protein
VLLFSLVATFLIGGFGILYFLGGTSQFVTLLVAIAWCALFIFLLLTARWSEDR